MRSMGWFQMAGIVGITGLVAGCVPAHPYSMRVDGETVVVEVLKPDELRVTGVGGGKPVAPVVSAGAVPVAAQSLITTTRPVFDEDRLEHTATYSATKAGSKFYADDKEGLSVQFGGVRVTRSIVNDGKPQTASVLTFSVDAQELSTNGQLQLVGDSAFVHFGKVKVEDRKWYLPWTWFKTVRDRIDADVHLVLEGHWVDDSDISHRADVADLHVHLRDLKLGEATDISTARSEWFPLIPRSKKPKPGTGAYVLKVTVTEYDEYGKLVTEVSDEVSSNWAGWLTKVKNSLSPSR